MVLSMPLKIKREIKISLLIILLLLVLQIIIFAPHVGRGFITDDFTWLENSVQNGKINITGPFTNTTGFFRPLVGLSFGIQYALHGMNPLPYGLFNMILHMLNIILLFLVLQNYEKTKPFAAAATALFALNSKAANMAVCWISGRTTLLVSFFFLLSLYLYLNDRKDSPSPLRAIRFFFIGFFFLASLLSKETTAAAPIFIFLFAALETENQKGKSLLKEYKDRFYKGMKAILPFVLPLIVYFLLRLRSNAFTPFTAPSYYQYTFAPGILMKNIGEYIVRSALLDIYILLIIISLALVFRVKKNPAAPGVNREIMLSGILWFLCFLFLTLPLPARSDLYAYLPQIGLHVLFLAFITRSPFLSPVIFLFRHDSEIKIESELRTRRTITTIVLLLLFISWTAYLWLKAGSERQKAVSSSLFTDQMAAAAVNLPEGSNIRVVDIHADEKNSPAKTVAYGFNALLNLYFPEKQLTGVIITVDSARELTRKELKNTVNYTWEKNKLTRFGRKLPRGNG
jgi:hypothetical protein